MCGHHRHTTVPLVKKERRRMLCTYSGCCKSNCTPMLHINQHTYILLWNIWFITMYAAICTAQQYCFLSRHWRLFTWCGIKSVVWHPYVVRLYVTAAVQSTIWLTLFWLRFTNTKPTLNMRPNDVFNNRCKSISLCVVHALWKLYY